MSVNYDYTETGKGRKKLEGRKKGEPALNRTLTNWEVELLRMLRHDENWSHDDLSAFFGISKTSSSAICLGRTYKDAPGPVGKSKGTYAKRGKRRVW